MIDSEHKSLAQGYIREIEAEGGEAMLQLAAQCRTALSRAGFNVAPREYDAESTKQSTHENR